MHRNVAISVLLALLLTVACLCHALGMPVGAAVIATTAAVIGFVGIVLDKP